MIQDYDSLSGDAKVWIYQADRNLTPDEADWTNAQIKSFTAQWKAHGQDLYATGMLRYNRFVVLVVDEGANAASGCSIDSSVHFIKELGSRLNVDFFDRTAVAFLDEEHKKAEVLPLAVVKQKIAAGEITAGRLMFNNLVQTKADFEENWIAPAGKSWLKNHFSQSAAAKP